MNQLAIAPSQPLANDPFSHSSYLVQRPFWTLLGRTFKVYAPDGQMCLFVRHKIMTFKDEWNIFSDESERVPLLRIKARQAIGLNIVTDVFDAQTGALLGTVKNRGLKSIIGDAWDVLGNGEAIVGELKEDSNGLLRRVLPSFFGMPLIPGRWHLSLNGAQAASIEERRKFFVKEFEVKLDNSKVNPRFAIATAMLALMRELMRERS